MATLATVGTEQGVVSRFAYWEQTASFSTSWTNTGAFYSNHRLVAKITLQVLTAKENT